MIKLPCCLYLSLMRKIVYLLFALTCLLLLKVNAELEAFRERPESKDFYSNVLSVVEGEWFCNLRVMGETNVNFKYLRNYSFEKTLS